MQKTTTVAIVTRNRCHDLHECLRSLANQVVLPSKILIINNNSQDETSKVISSFQSQLNIQEFIEKRVGYPHVYNRALEECKTEWITFLDDDCIAHPLWFSQIIDSINKTRSRQVAALWCQSYNYFTKNSFACAFQYGNLLWKSQCLAIDETIVDYRVLDSRNITYNKALLNKYKIRFNPTLTLGNEDADLGVQIHKAKLTASHIPTMIVYHKEPHTWAYYKAKKIAYKKSCDFYITHLTPPIHLQKVSPIQKAALFSQATKDLPLFKRIAVVCLIMLNKLIILLPK